MQFNVKNDPEQGKKKIGTGRMPVEVQLYDFLESVIVSEQSDADHDEINKQLEALKQIFGVMVQESEAHYKKCAPYNDNPKEDGSGGDARQSYQSACQLRTMLSMTGAIVTLNTDVKQIKHDLAQQCSKQAQLEKDVSDRPHPPLPTSAPAPTLPSPIPVVIDIQINGVKVKRLTHKKNKNKNKKTTKIKVTKDCSVDPPPTTKRSSGQAMRVKISSSHNHFGDLCF